MLEKFLLLRGTNPINLHLFSTVRLCDRSESLLENLVVHCHVCIDLVKEVGVKLELKLFFFRLYVLRLIGLVVVNYFISTCVDNIALCEFLFVLIWLATLRQENTIAIFGEQPHLFICLEIF